MLSNAIKEEVIENSKKKVCHFCGKKLDGREITIDHLLPTHRGGTDNLNNLAICCYECNQEKGCMTEQEYFQYKKLTTNLNLEEKLYMREVIMYNIYNMQKIDFKKLEKFLLLNRRENFVKDTLLKMKNDTNIYKKYYTDNTMEILQLKNIVEHLERENKQLKQEQDNFKLNNTDLLKDNKDILDTTNTYIHVLNNIKTIINNSLNGNCDLSSLNLLECKNSNIVHHQDTDFDEIVVINTLQHNMKQKLISKSIDDICLNVKNSDKEMILYKYKGVYFLIDNLEAYIAYQNGVNVKSTIVDKFRNLSTKQKHIVMNSNLMGAC